uniref:TBC1 domain family member 7 n=1 Tax=Strigamia maritima TaxID=126957 RepID=T1JLX8_STRMM
MAEDQRNFRSYYYSKVGFPSVPEKKSLEILFKDNEIDELKLAQFCARFPLPAVHRMETWKILLKVLPRFQSNRDFVWNVRRDMFFQAQEAILIMNLATEQTPSPTRFLKCYLFAEQTLLFNHEKQETESNSQHFLAFATIFSQLCETEEEAYWLSRNMFNMVKRKYDQTPTLVEKVKSTLIKEDPELSEYLTRKNLNLPFTQWFCRCFAGVLPISSLIRIWDRVIGGAIMFLPYVAVALLIGLRRQIMAAENLDQVLSAIINTSQETAEVIVNMSMDVSQKYNVQIGSGVNEVARNRSDY